MTLWRSLQTFSRRLPFAVWLAISLLSTGASWTLTQRQTRQRTAQAAALQTQTAALRVQTAALNANTASLEPLRQEVGALEKRGHVTSKQVRLLQERLSQNTRKSESIRAEMKVIESKIDEICQQ